MYWYLLSSYIFAKGMYLDFQILCYWTIFVGCWHFQHPLLFLSTLQCIFGIVDRIGKLIFSISLSNSIVWIESLRAYKVIVYSISVDETDISVCSWYLQLTGKPESMVMYPCLDTAVSMLWYYTPPQFPLKSVSMYNSMYLSPHGLRLFTLYYLAFK